VNEAAQVVTSAADQNANVIFGAVINETQRDEIRVTVIATGFGPARLRRRRRTEEPVEESKEEGQREPAEGFEFNDDVLEVPSFLRD
jgi:cell division protein FtsZ